MSEVEWCMQSDLSRCERMSSYPAQPERFRAGDIPVPTEFGPIDLALRSVLMGFLIWGDYGRLGALVHGARPRGVDCHHRLALGTSSHTNNGKFGRLKQSWARPAFFSPSLLLVALPSPDHTRPLLARSAAFCAFCSGTGPFDGHESHGHDKNTGHDHETSLEHGPAHAHVFSLCCSCTD